MKKTYLIIFTLIVFLPACNENPTNEQGIPSYFLNEINDTTSKIAKATEEGESIVIPIFTDTHYTYDKRGIERLDETFANINEVNSNINCNAVAFLGDISDLWGRQGLEDLIIYDRFSEFINKFRKTHETTFLVPGNHDGDSTDFFNNENWYPISNYNSEYICREGNNPYYYYDFPSMKIRLIFMSIPSSTEDLRMTHGINIGNYLSDRTVYTYWGAGKKQLEWLANTALKTGDEWKVILFSHVPTCYQSSYINDLMGRVEDQTSIEGIFNAYHNQNQYSDNNISCDFSLYQNTKVILAVAGHTHYDAVVRPGHALGDATNNLPCTIVVIGCAVLSGEGRNDKSLTQELWDVMVFNNKSAKFSFIRFGYGEDREIILD